MPEVTLAEIANIPRHPIYLDELIIDETNIDGKMPLIEGFECKECQDPWKEIFLNELKEKIEDALNKLPAKQKFAVWYKFGLDGLGILRNNVETAIAMYKEQGICSKIGENMPLTGADIYFHVNKAKKKLKKIFIKENLEDYI